MTTGWLRVALVAGALAAFVGLAALSRALEAFEIPDDAFGDSPRLPDGFGGT